MPPEPELIEACRVRQEVLDAMDRALSEIAELARVQNDLAERYESGDLDPSLRGQGTSTASQTAWAIMALVSAGYDSSDAAIVRGLQYLISTQRRDGTWDEPYYTGTGFPGYGFGARLDFRDKHTKQRIAQGTELQRGFMINYNLYRHYFPLMAMGRARTRSND